LRLLSDPPHSTTIVVLTTLLIAYIKATKLHGAQGHKGMWASQVPHEFFKSFMCLSSPLELILLFEDVEDGIPPDAESRDESA
jgi:hypothetical protein